MDTSVSNKAMDANETHEMSFQSLFSKSKWCLITAVYSLPRQICINWILVEIFDEFVISPSLHYKISIFILVSPILIPILISVIILWNGNYCKLIEGIIKQ